MTVVEIGLTRLQTRFASIAAFTFQYTVNIQRQAQFWTRTFGVASEATDDKIHILAVYINSTDRLLMVTTLDECKATSESWFFDYNEQKLAVNYGPLYSPLFDTVDYQFAVGFCDIKPVFIDSVSYLPLLKTAPNIKHKQDIIGNNKLAMTTGSLLLNNQTGDLDFLRNITLFNNDARVYFLDDEDGRDEYAREELEQIAQMLIEDVNISMIDGKITLQDLRNSFDVKLPIDVFTESEYPDIEDDLIDTPIPLCYGPCRSIPAYCVNGTLETWDAHFRAAYEMTSFGTAQVKIDDTWVTVSKYDEDPSTGTFSIQEPYARGLTYGGEWNANTNVPPFSDATGNEGSYRLVSVSGTQDLGSGSIDFTAGQWAVYRNGRWSSSVSRPTAKTRECRLVECTGKTINRLTDVLIDLDIKANGVNYSSSFFNTTEWASEAASIVSGGYYLRDQKSLLEIIKDIQDGANKRFRFEINGDGLRTLRVDDNARAVKMYVAKEKIKENETFEVGTDRSSVFAFSKVKYNTDYSGDAFSTVIDTSREDAVARNMRQRPTIEYNTYLRTKGDAEARAAREAEMLGEVWQYLSCTLMGEEFLSLRIFDILEMELFTETRPWMGVWKAKVIALEPKDRSAKVTVQLIERVPFDDEDRKIRVTSDGDIRIAAIGADEYRREYG